MRLRATTRAVGAALTLTSALAAAVLLAGLAGTTLAASDPFMSQPPVRQGSRLLYDLGAPTAEGSNVRVSLPSPADQMKVNFSVRGNWSE